MPVAIRKAERQDLESLGRLGVLLIQTHYAFDTRRFLAPFQGAEGRYAQFLGGVLESSDSCVFVAEQEERIVGYVYAALEPMSWQELRGPAGFIHDVIVAEEARHSGVGTKLIEAAVEWLRARGTPRVLLDTSTSNEEARALFRRLGFRETMLEMTKELAE